MMTNINLTIKHVKNIINFNLQIPLSNNIYCLVGENGIGKSTVMVCLASLVFPNSLRLFQKEDLYDDSEIKVGYGDKINSYAYDSENSRLHIHGDRYRLNGLYEGSLFYGTRFCDSLKIDELVKNMKIQQEEIVNSDEYVKEKMSKILHGKPHRYENLKRIRNKNVTKKLGLKNTPYFNEFNGNLVSQYRMSSGECLLLSLLHFIYNAVERRSLPSDQPILIMIDEIELALHPSAVRRLMDLLVELTNEHKNLTVILSSHSPELIRRIHPDKLYMLEGVEKSTGTEIHIVNPCYPCYAIRDIYMPNGFDFVFLVEDELAKKIVRNCINKIEAYKNRLINVLPVGGWENVLKLHKHLVKEKQFGNSTKIISVLDGDVKNEKQLSNYDGLEKYFLPVSSVEKYIRKILIDNEDYHAKKFLNDRFFQLDSLDGILEEYHNAVEKSTKDKNGKKLYSLLKKHLDKQKITEDEFINGIYDLIQEKENFSKFINNLGQIVSLTK